jgi:hypothetical protein
LQLLQPNPSSEQTGTIAGGMPVEHGSTQMTRRTDQKLLLKKKKKRKEKDQKLYHLDPKK